MNVSSKSIQEGCQELVSLVQNLSGDSLLFETKDVDERELGYSEAVSLF